MPDATFSHSLFWTHPIASMCFFALMMSFISLWVRKTFFLWGSFFIIAYILALEARIVNWLSLIPILILFLCHYFLSKATQRGARFLLFGSAVVISVGLNFHFFPGFHNWNLISNVTLSSDASPYSLWLNFDKPLMGIFALSFSIPLITSIPEFRRVLKTCIPLSIIGIFILMGISLYFNLVKWDPKIPSFFFVWFLNNLILVSIPEEAFFRGFFQRWLYNWFGDNPMAGVGSIFVTSLLFTLLHLIWVANLSFLSLVFVASIIYGVVYQVTKSLEASIFCHFGLNLTHFLFFSYPALQG